MNKKFFSIILLTVASICGGLRANSAAATQTSPIVVVNMEEISKVAVGTKDISDLQAKFQQEFQDKVAKATKLEKEFQDKVANYRNKSKDMTIAARENTEKELAKMQAELEAENRNLQAYMQRVEGEIGEKILSMVREVCEQKGYLVVMPKTIHAAASVDKTAEVIKAIDAKFKPAIAAPKKA